MRSPYDLPLRRLHNVTTILFSRRGINDGVIGWLRGYPEKLGVSQQQWDSMTEAQREQMRAGYEQVQREYKHISTVYAGPVIAVTMAGGTVMMPPFLQAQTYQPVNFEVKPGQCRRIYLDSTAGHRYVNLPACYDGLTLYLDPSRYDTQLSYGSLRFNYNPMWKRGFSYQGMSSLGYVHLNKVNITIHAISDMPAVMVTPQNLRPITAKPAVSQTEEVPSKQVVAPTPAPAANTSAPMASPVSEQTSIPVAATTDTAEKLAPVEDIEHSGP